MPWFGPPVLQMKSILQRFPGHFTIHEQQEPADLMAGGVEKGG
ncbi:hypothetical protein NY78_1653 [Desulfovibrio sp. TomC]|nr:hypothetical protein NY78_1653 [Desulfovibrio sp. TomC]